MPSGGMSNGVCTEGVSLDGSLFRGALPDGTEVSGDDFVGAQFLARLSSGGLLRLRIDDMEQGTDRDPDVFTYGVSFRVENEWYPLCGVDEETGEAVRAIPMQGKWDYAEGVPGAGGRIDDPDSFTFACRGHALAKCIELGYHPWENLEGRSLADYHEACVRLIRADFCGDGVSWTENGTLINVYDDLGVQLDEAEWGVEAAWTQDGALCIAPDNFRVHKPACYDDLVSETCGADALEGDAMLVTEFSEEANSAHE